MSSLITSSAIGAPSRELIRRPRLESPQWAFYPLGRMQQLKNREASPTPGAPVLF